MKIELETNKWRFESHVNENELRVGNETSIRIIIYYHVYDIHIARGHFMILSLGGGLYKSFILSIYYWIIVYMNLNCIDLSYKYIPRIYCSLNIMQKKDKQSSVWKQR